MPEREPAPRPIFDQPSGEPPLGCVCPTSSASILGPDEVVVDGVVVKLDSEVYDPELEDPLGDDDGSGVVD